MNDTAQKLLQAFEDFVASIPLERYRQELLLVKTVEQDLPKSLNPLDRADFTARRPEGDGLEAGAGWGDCWHDGTRGTPARFPTRRAHRNRWIVVGGLAQWRLSGLARRLALAA